MRAATALRLGVGACGVAMMGFGAWTLWVEKARIGQPASIGRWVVGGVIGHDAILAPAVFIACALVGRLTGPRVRRALALFLLAGGSLVIVGLPDILRRGDNPNPTVTPLDYPRNLAIALGAVAVIAVLSVVAGGVRDRRRRAQEARLQAQAQAALERAEQEAMAQAAREAQAEAVVAPESEPEAVVTPESEPEAVVAPESKPEAVHTPESEPPEPELEPVPEPEAPSARPAEPQPEPTEQDGGPEDE